MDYYFDVICYEMADGWEKGRFEEEDELSKSLDEPEELIEQDEE